MDGSTAPCVLGDQVFADIMKTHGLALANVSDGDDYDAPAYLMLEDARRVVADLLRMHCMAAQVLQARLASIIDLRSSWKVQAEPEGVVVHFDNCSQTNGIQRAYVACSCSHHAACFKYMQLSQFGSPQEVVAWLAAWSNPGRGADVSFNKDAHKSFCPEPSVWKALVPSMHEIPRYHGLHNLF